MSQPYGQQPGDYNQPPQGYGAMPPAPPEYTGGPVARPGTVTAAAVLDFVQAGITIISSIILMIGLGAVSSAVGEAETVGGLDIDEGMLAVMWIVVLAGMVGAGLLIWAAVKALSGTAGNLMAIANGLQILLCVVWLILEAPIAIAFAIMPIIALVLAMQAPAKQFEASRRGH